MDPKYDRTVIERILIFVFLALINVAAIVYLLHPIASLSAQIFLYALVGCAIVEDGLVLAWSTNWVPNTGMTIESSVSGIWGVGQILQVVMLTVLVGSVSIAMAVIVFIVSIFWIRTRVIAMNKTMDLRYW